MKKLSFVLIAVLLASIVAIQASAVMAASPAHSNAGGRQFGALWYEGYQVRTFVPNGHPLNHPGTDPLYAFPSEDPEEDPIQASVIQFAPGDPQYHGGHWKVYVVTWNVEPYTIKSYDALMNAAGNSDVSITRMPDADVLCPVMP